MLDELGAVGFPKTSGGKGLHVYVRIAPSTRSARCGGRRGRSPARWSAGRRELVTTAWWRKDRAPGTVFVDYNQNTRDHTIACAYSVRGTPLGDRVRAGAVGEIPDVEPADFSIATMPARFAELGDLHAGIDEAVFDLSPLLEWAERDSADVPDVPADELDV